MVKPKFLSQVGVHVPTTATGLSQHQKIPPAGFGREAGAADALKQHLGQKCFGRIKRQCQAGTQDLWHDFTKNYAFVAGQNKYSTTPKGSV